jgi:pimeloyl-ACP methyl ester carboxylesterase
MSKDIVFIHGAWMTPACWEPLMGYFEGRGYRTSAPAWPGKAGDLEIQRSNPSLDLVGLGIEEILHHYQSLLNGFSDPPILIGHSFGGLFTQILLDRGYGAAGVAIDAAPPRGIFAYYPTALRSLGRVLLTWRGWKRILVMPYSDFRYGFANCVTEEQARAAYDRYVVPETGRIFFQAALAPLDPNSPTRIRFDNPDRAPLLLVAGGSDHIVPARVNRANFKRYRGSPARTDFKEFPDRCHWTIAQPGWEALAEAIHEWLESLPT